MDRRSWLWRRKSSEKSPGGETESSGSVSLRSERFSDDQTLSNHNTQSPEVTSKAVLSDNEVNDNLKILSEKLSEALLDIHAKEDLVTQHARVAEEAVSGWERAENALTQKNSVLEERIGHLDGALKECVRQLRQAREDQDKKIYDAIAKKSCEWESTKSELENQLIELHYQLQNAKTDAITSLLADARSKLESAEKENSILKLELFSKAGELEQRTCERDLSTHAAETASKQHLDSIIKVAKLEAECRRLKVVAHKAAAANDHQSVTASSIYVESFMDSQSDYGERIFVDQNDSCKMSGLESIGREPCLRDSWAYSLVTEGCQFKNERTLERSFVVPSVEIDLMDDFLEMERLVALPETKSGSTCSPFGGENPLRGELEAMINRTAELEEIIEKMDAEKVNLEMALNNCQNQLKTSEDQLKQTGVKLVDLSAQLAVVNEAKDAVQTEVNFTKLSLKNSTKLLHETEVNLVQFQNQLTLANEAKSICEVQLEDANTKKAEAESKLRVMEHEQETLRASICTLEDEVKNERKFSNHADAKCHILETEISRMKLDSQLQRSVIIEEFRITQDKELSVAASKFVECQKTIASLSWQLKSLATLEDLLIESEGQS